jgi:hypothetical protein
MRKRAYPATHPSPRKTTDNIRDTNQLLRTTFLVGEAYQRHRWQCTSLPPQLKSFPKTVLRGELRRTDVSWRRIGALNDRYNWIAKTLGVIFVCPKNWLEDCDVARGWLHINRRGATRLSQLYVLQMDKAEEKRWIHTWCWTIQIRGHLKRRETSTQENSTLTWVDREMNPALRRPSIHLCWNIKTCTGYYTSCIERYVHDYSLFAEIIKELNHGGLVGLCSCAFGLLTKLQQSYIKPRIYMEGLLRGKTFVIETLEKKRQLECDTSVVARQISLQWHCQK